MASSSELADLVTRHKLMITSEANGESAAWLEFLKIEAVFGSNFIERSGMSYDLTKSICEAIFRGEQFEEEVPEASDEYDAGVQHLISSGRLEPEEDPCALFLTSRKEVVQHARAFDFIIKAMVQRDELLTESLILQTHKILMDGISHEDGTPAEEYAGLYRKEPVYALAKGANKPHKFLHPSAVPGYMKDMINNYRADTIRSTTQLEPFTLASRYAWYFVNIHPFADGNGRMCRLIMNAILLKYAGIVVPIGEDGEAGRAEYLKICTQGSKEFLDEDDRTSVTQHGHQTLADYVTKRATIRLKERIARFT